MTALTTQALNHSITMEQKLRAKDEVIAELLELLNRYTATAEVKLQEGRIESEQEAQDYLESAKLLNQYYGKKYSISGVEELMNKI
jgi:ABC-type transporter Mla subunit MlaD